MIPPRLHLSWLIAVALSPPASPAHVSADPAPVYRIQFSSSDEVTQIAIETGGKVQYQNFGRLRNPDRLFYDLVGLKLPPHGNATESIPMVDRLVKRIRFAQRTEDVTRIVLDLRQPVQVVVSQGTNPDRFLLELRPSTPMLLANQTGGGRTLPASSPESPRAVSHPLESLALAAKPTRNDNLSLIRALGLKVTRVVLDPGHGGDDAGAVSQGGLKEKDVVLDVAQRLGSAIHERLNSDVIYTRSDDNFVPLEARPTLAKETQADLFISIHANWSPSSAAAGSETYILNLNHTGFSLDVASRENARSRKSVHDLQDLVQQIALNEKESESREFAASVQASLTSALFLDNAEERDRGVKQAPFMVLVGSRVPSILVEIGFLSNPQEEDLLKHSDHRQHIADALYRGIAQYVNRLSHFDIANRD